MAETYYLRLRRRGLELPTTGEPDIFDFELSLHAWLTTQAAFTGPKGPCLRPRRCCRKNSTRLNSDIRLMRTCFCVVGSEDIRSGLMKCRCQYMMGPVPAPRCAGGRLVFFCAFYTIWPLQCSRKVAWTVSPKTYRPIRQAPLPGTSRRKWLRAVVGLGEASKLLENSGYGSAEMMEECLAALRAAECRMTCVLFAWRDYLSGRVRQGIQGS
jgi:hypothetical protein